MNRVTRRWLACLASLGLLGASAPPSGRVLDHLTGLPLGDATVRWAAGGAPWVTDEDGWFRLGEAPGPGPDTLVVEHPDYAPFRLAVGDAGSELPLTIRMTLVTAAPDSTGTGAREAAEAFAARTGGDLWAEEAFRPFLLESATVLDPLLFSGLVAAVETDRVVPCIRIRAGLPCAALTFRPDTPGASWRNLLPAQVDSYVVVLPDPGAPGSRPGTEGGRVRVFLEVIL